MVLIPELINAFLLKEADFDWDSEVDFWVPINQIAKSIEATLESFAEAEVVRMKKQLESFEQRLVKQLKQRHEQVLQSIDFISERIIPENSLQERYFHWLQFAPSGAYKELLKQIHASTQKQE